MRKTGTNQKCENCGTDFYVPGWRAKDAPKFCSMACLHAGRKPRAKKTPVQLVCAECAKPFLVPQHRASTAKFCSKSCAIAVQMRERHAANRRQASSDDMKVCSCCGEEKLRSEFYSRPEPGKSLDGLRADCKSCCEDRQRLWLSKEGNHEQKIEADRIYHQREADRINREARGKYATDPEPIRTKNKQWRDNNLEAAKENSRRRRREKPDVVRAARRQHYRDNKGRYVAQARAREERVALATPLWADMKAIEQFYIEAERLTQQTGIKHHVDHIYPLRGKTMCGLHVEANLQVVPALVNLQKGNSVFGEATEPRCCAWPDMAVMQFRMAA